MAQTAAIKTPYIMVVRRNLVRFIVKTKVSLRRSLSTRRSRTDLMRSSREVSPPLEHDTTLSWRHSQDRQERQEKPGQEDVRRGMKPHTTQDIGLGCFSGGAEKVDQFHY